MEIAWRQFLRSLFVSIAVFLLPLVLTGNEYFAQWILNHFIFLLLWLILCILIGYVSHYFADNLTLYSRLSSVFVKFGFSLPQTDFKKLPFFIRLPLLWSSCSRCISYWSGGVLSFAAAAFYFNPPFWAAGSYFLVMGATLSGAFASLFSLIQIVGESKKHPD